MSKSHLSDHIGKHELDFLHRHAVVALTDYFKGKVECGSWKYWLLVLTIIPVVLLVTLFARHYLLEKRRIRKVRSHTLDTHLHFVVVKGILTTSGKGNIIQEMLRDQHTIIGLSC